MEVTNKKLPEKGKKSIATFLQELFLYFWITSLIGHYLELVLSFLNQLIYGGRLWVPIIQTKIPISAPYGIGMVVVILVTLPLIRKYKLHPIGVFVLNTVVTGTVEYICAAVIVASVGYNRYWGYANQPFNINGYVCLKSAVIFGIGATLFIYLLYPLIEKLVAKLKHWQLNIIFWLLFGDYFIELSVLFAIGRVFN